MVHKIVAMLSTFGVLPEQIDIEQNFFRPPLSKFNIITRHDSLILYVLCSLQYLKAGTMLAQKKKMPDQ